MNVLPVNHHAGQNLSDCELNKLREELKNLSEKERRFYRFWKRIFDVVFSAAAMVVLSPCFLVLIVLIFLDDPTGSPIYAQTRIGRKGKPFRLYKFRTMVMGADQMISELREQNETDGPVFKMKNDPRVTRLGKYLRKTSLDELPQFWNVIRGDMTLVGPRPPLPQEVEYYNEYHRLRLMVTPGLTCYWQTMEQRNSISFEDWVDLDIRYIRERSFLLDLKLILRTIKVMIEGQGE